MPDLDEYLHELVNSPKLQITEKFLDQIQASMQVSELLPATINCQEPDTVRKAQRALSSLEARLDFIMRVQHQAKRILQTIKSAELQLKRSLREQEVLKGKLTKAQVEDVLNEEAPDLVLLLVRWSLVETLCADAQKRLAEAKSTLKLQKDLDDNLRWAQHR